MANCISPITVRHDDQRYVVPCGKCNFCLKNRRSDWCLRLKHEEKKSINSQFVTLTYATENLPISETGHPTLIKKDLQDFWKRLRKAQSKISKHKIRYFICGEYGTKKGRPHYHAILFNCVLDIQQIQKCWSKGLAHSGTVTAKSIRYVTKYIINRFDPPHQSTRDAGEGLLHDSITVESPFTMMSRRPGLGFNYVTTHKNYHRKGFITHANDRGVKTRLPRYYKEKIFNEWEIKRISITNKRKAQEQYEKTIKELSKVHSDPYLYHEQMIAQAHDRISADAKKKSKF